MIVFEWFYDKNEIIVNELKQLENYKVFNVVRLLYTADTIMIVGASCFLLLLIIHHYQLVVVGLVGVQGFCLPGVAYITIILAG